MANAADTTMVNAIDATSATMANDADATDTTMPNETAALAATDAAEATQAARATQAAEATEAGSAVAPVATEADSATATAAPYGWDWLAPPDADASEAAGVTSEEAALPGYTFRAEAIEVWDNPPFALPHTGDVVVIDRETIEASGSASVPELLQREANVRFESFNGKASQAQVSLRGFGENSGLRVLVIVDGQRLNRPDLGGIEWQQIALDDIESIEVLRGGNNVLYGNYALAGVIQIRTRRGGPLRSKIWAETGSDGYDFVAADHAGSHGPWFWDVGASGLRDNGYRDQSLTWNRSASATLGREFGESGSDLSLSANVTEGYIEFPGPLTYQEFRDNPRQYGYQGSPFDYETEYLNSLLALSWNGKHRWGATYLNASVTTRDQDLSLGGSESENDQISGTLSPRIRVGSEKRHIMTGLDLAYDHIDYVRYRVVSDRVVNSVADLSRYSVGPFVYARQPISDDWTLSGGARYELTVDDYVNVDFEDSQLDRFLVTNRGVLPNPAFKDPPDVDPSLSYDDVLLTSGFAAEVGLEWQLNTHWQLWGGYDRVYRYPAMDETASYQGFAIINRPLNTELDPEQGDQWDVGVRYEGAAWTGSVTAYYLQLDSEIAFDTSRNENVNLGKTRRVGSDVSLRYDGRQWGAATLWSFVDARFLGAGPNGNALEGRFVPLVPWAHGVHSVWVEPIRGIEAAAYYSVFAERWQGNDYANQLRQVDAFDRLDLRLTATYEPLTFYVRVDNVLDRATAPLAFGDEFYPAPGRQWRVGMKITF